MKKKPALNKTKKGSNLRIRDPRHYFTSVGHSLVTYGSPWLLS
jgi:hypothetical protein